MPKRPVKDGDISRRTVIASAALIPVAAIKSTAQPQSVFSEAQRRTLEAAVDRLIPKDELGPGAVECGAVNYIDLSLADALAGDKAPLLDGLAALDVFARSKYDAAFAGLSPDKQDELLTAIENNTATGFRPNSRAFFDRLRRLTFEGVFSDPHYGGNRNYGGWDLIRYPGPRLAVSPDDQKIKAEIKPVRMSAYGGSHGH